MMARQPLLAGFETFVRVIPTLVPLWRHYLLGRALRLSATCLPATDAWERTATSLRKFKQGYMPYFDISRNIVDVCQTCRYEASMNIEDVAARLEALGHPTRLRLFRILVRAGAPGLPVGQLQERLEIAPSTLSHHLSKLVAVGLIVRERQATSLICRAEFDRMRELVGALEDECCIEQAQPATSRGVPARRSVN